MLLCLENKLVSTNVLLILCLILIAQSLHGVTPASGFIDQLYGASLPPELLVLITAALLRLETHLWVRKTEEFIQQNQLQEPDFACKTRAPFKLQVCPPE